MSGVTIDVSGMSKRFGDVLAVDGVTFRAEPGRVTGFLGPNGAGKSTTLRMLLGLVRADEGTAHFGGSAYLDLLDPSGTVGAVLDLAAAHPATTARGHLHTYCALGGHPAGRVEDVIAQVQLDGFADRRVGGFSTGMRQRLSLATALLGDPAVLVLDEPSNGLDPAGIAWLRAFLRDVAAAGRTILLSSHVLSELQHGIDDLVLIDQGRISWTGPITEFTTDGLTLEEAFLERTREGATR
ncbi:ABC transporter ATP-binding protein [Agromyces aerolatus]|uniref:ABC transporter ATP-binding protein n=1 Tax=Agromyces sp. LY-1074 TaxID=3074080 RepID=UPI0028591370|nr:MULTISPECIES: ATP-binding cassette domain-containing protein [unclassified Agromyces]MDR5700945.1 ATP-binding cassette domain-containing protein [Agromyces sp. LY-1074]MDR5707394.1 ATP-binding cassette domain-containing protein [Agromyces sp. LY-1358]